MGLRSLFFLLVAGTLLWESQASPHRLRRQVSNNFPSNQPSSSSEPRAYQPPIALGAPVPVATSQHNSYQPPISLIRSNEYQSPLNPQQNPYPGNAPRTYQSPGPQTYVLPNQPQQHHHQHQSHSIQYIPPAIPSVNQQQSFSVFQQPPSSQYSLPQPATSYSVHSQQPPHQSNQGGQSFAILSDNSGLPQSTAERTYSTHSKVVGSHVPAQAIHKAPASEIQSDKGPAAKEKDKSNDEYVVYYYYYYDNDTTANNNNNLSLNFDDIPSLESYDNDKLVGKEPEKNARTLSGANINSLSPEKDASSSQSSVTSSQSQPRSVGGDAYSSRPGGSSGHHPLDDTSLVQPLKPVSNVFRYGANEVPRFPVLPNFVVTEVPTTARPEISTPGNSLTTEPPATQPAPAQPDLKTGDEADDDLNNVLDNNAADLKAAIEEKEKSEEEPTTTTTTTTTEPPTTTEEPTTTTERPRRRPSLGGGRRRFNPSSSSSFSSNRNRQVPSRSTTSSSSTTTTTTTTSAPPPRRSFQGSRTRPRPPIGSNRPRPGSRTTSESSEPESSNSRAATTESSTTASSASTTSSSRSRFTSATASPPRRFQSSRSRSQTSSTTSTTTTTRSPSSSISRSRPTSRPRPNLISRNRPPRPGFPRPGRPGSEPEEPEPTTVPPTKAAAEEDEETSPETDELLPSTNDERSNETEEDNETSEEETEEPTTTEGSRFSALFRPRNRNALGNRPRPVIGNRPSRS